MSGEGPGAIGRAMLSIVRVVVGGMAGDGDEEEDEVRKPCMRGMVIMCGAEGRC